MGNLILAYLVILLITTLVLFCTICKVPDEDQIAKTALRQPKGQKGDISSR